MFFGELAEFRELRALFNQYFRGKLDLLSAQGANPGGNISGGTKHAVGEKLTGEHA
jgi:hypothetical protein